MLVFFGPIKRDFYMLVQEDEFVLTGDEVFQLFLKEKIFP